MTPPTIENLLKNYVHMSNEDRERLNNLVAETAAGMLSQWMWQRVIRKTGPVLLQLQNGKHLSAKDSRLLLTAMTLTVYIVARNAYIGWRSASRVFAVTDAWAASRIKTTTDREV